ncbi:MAG TPA: hypothetical protein ENI04_00140, partial [Candidatus Wildermuthbacteria bacterium]|nr:hypothetical protein [Candidatus Wildermuthbacteria bacterium]
MPASSFLNANRGLAGASRFLQDQQKDELQQLREYGYEVPEESGWSLLGKKFLNTVGGVLDVLRTDEYAIGGILSGKGARAGIEEKISPSEALGIRTDETELWTREGISGLIIDILLSPTTYLTFGAGGALKIVTKGGQIAVNKTGVNLMKTMVEKGASEATARRAIAKLIQQGGEKAANKYIGKSGLRFMGQMFIPAENFRVVGKIANKIPGAGLANKVGSGFSRAFVPFREIDKMPANLGGQGTYTDFLYKPYVRETKAKIFREIDEVKVVAQKAYKEHGIEVGSVIGKKIEQRELTGDEFLDEIIDWMGKEQEELLQIERATGKPIAKIEGYLRHYLTPEGREFLEGGSNFLGALPKPLRAKLGPEKSRKFIKFVDEEGKAVVGTQKSLGLEKIEIMRGISNSIDVGDLRTIDDVRKLLAKYGMTLRFVPKPTVRKTAFGYFDTKSKQLVVASDRNFSDVIKTLRHEMTHGGHFQMAGAIDMAETFSKRGKFAKTKTALEAAKDAARQEFKGILKSIPVDTANLPPNFQTYVKQPAELLAFAAGSMQANPDLAAQLFPKTAKALGNLQDIPLFSQITEYGKTGVAAKFAYSTKEGKLVEATTATIEEVNTFMKEAHGIEKFFEPDAFKAFGLRKVESIRFVNTHRFIETAKARFFTRIDKVDSLITPEGIKLVESTNPQLKGWVGPEPIVSHVDEMMQVLTNEKSLGGFIKMYDRALRFFKVNVTGIWPAFHTRNFIGGSFNNWLGYGHEFSLSAGAKEAAIVQDTFEVEKILRGADEGFKTKLGEQYDGKQFIDLAERFGVRGQPGTMDVYRQVEEAVEEITATGVKSAAIKAGNAPRWAMEQVEDRLRLPLFMRGLKEGLSPSQAAKIVFKYHFDYLPETGFTNFERIFMRRIIPFYTWSRNNVPLQIEMLMRQPGKYANLERLRQTMFDSDTSKELKYLPDWMKDMFLFPLPMKDELGKTLWVQLDLPLDDIRLLPINSSS